MDIEKMVDSATQSVLNRRRRPASTYRLQFNYSFTFRQAAALVPYLHELGITDCYASPYLKARPGSVHGYDISDHNSLNPEIGTWEEYLEFTRALQDKNMGQILDFVPNHMGIFDNPWWNDVLENGPCSPYANSFDIDWDPVKPELRNKVLLPVLEDQYGKILQSGQLQLTLEQGGFRLVYHDHSFPIDPKTTLHVLEPVLEELSQRMDASDPDLVEIQSITTACRNLPDRERTDIEAISERQREKEVIKKRLWQIYDGNPQIKAALDREIKKLNGTPEDGASYDSLHALLETQAYRLSYWRVASDETNYRRFFDINELVALRMDLPSVFEQSHGLIRKLVGDGLINGIRIDHIDGLMDPAGYLERLQRLCFLEETLKQLQEQGLKEADQQLLFDLIHRKYKTLREEDTNHASPVFFYILVEKILGEKEYLRETWPTAGTTGYEFAVGLNGLFVDRRNTKSILNTYRKFTGTSQSFKEIVYRSKNLLMMTSMSGEVNVIAQALDRISEGSRSCRDFTLPAERDATREVIACFPVYRSYIDAFHEHIDKRDKAAIDAAVVEAKRRNPAISASLFEFIRHTLLLHYPPDMNEEWRDQQRYFVMRFQQYSGPVMAKGLEDTAFYIYNPLVSLNEVGGNPEKLGTRVTEFHENNAYRLSAFPFSMLSTSSHDSKRSEDVRARINVLSEIPRQWRAALRRWSQLNEKHKHDLNGDMVPDRNEEYLIYQTLLGTFPTEDLAEPEYEAYVRRIKEYLLKALREAKVHTSWISPNTDYEEYATQFLSGILEKSPSNAFLAEFAPLNSMVADCGMFNSLSQSLLKIFSPGVPDIYQGNELWNYVLVDPDNRQPVDFGRRHKMLHDLRKEFANTQDHSAFARSLVDERADGRIKLFVTWRSLTLRRDHVSLFRSGSYIPLQGAGALADHICAFAWKGEPDYLLVIAPRLLARLTGNAFVPPVGNSVWQESQVVLPATLGGQVYTNLFTGEKIDAGSGRRMRKLPLSNIFSSFPVAVLHAKSGN